MKPLEIYQPNISESDVVKSLVHYLCYSGWLVIRVNSGAITQTDAKSGRKRHHKFCTWYVLGMEPQSAGVSDILAIEPGGCPWAIEAKKPGKLKNTTESQRAFQAAWIERGGVAVTVDGLEGLQAEIEKRRRESLPTRIR